mmetsp:Transcript_33166/g.30085  ORF Transcript_33166/g.30085 Transcript_33166/m.30085 type:complete len:80 (-) Transcript_33166:738-977(-)
MGVKKLLRVSTLKEIEKPKNQVNKYNDYCEPIKQNKEQIKIKMIEYLKKILTYYYKELRDVVAFKPDILGLIRRIVIGT